MPRIKLCRLLLHELRLRKLQLEGLHLRKSDLLLPGRELLLVELQLHELPKRKLHELLRRKLPGRELLVGLQLRELFRSKLSGHELLLQDATASGCLGDLPRGPTLSYGG